MRIVPLAIAEPAEAVGRTRQADVRARARPARREVGRDDRVGPEVSVCSFGIIFQENMKGGQAQRRPAEHSVERHVSQPRNSSMRQNQGRRTSTYPPSQA